MAVLFAVMFIFWRIMEIVTLIPTMGMLAYFVNGYVNNNQLTPDYILILFITSVLALAWAIFTLFAYHRSSTNATFLALVDLAFVGAFIASVYYLRFIAGANCTSVSPGSYSVSLGVFGTFNGNDLTITTQKICAMLKACFAFGIMNCIFFFITAILAWIHSDRSSEKTYYRETHRTRNTGHRGSSRHSRRSSHSHRRVYV